MKMSRLGSLASMATASVLLCGTQALAQESNHRLVREAQNADHNQTNLPRLYMARTSPRPDIYGLQATMTQVFPTIGANADGTDIWPCFGYGTAYSNVDCPTVGSPAIPMPVGSIVIGVPQFTWMLANNSGYGYGGGDGNGIGCDAFANGTTGPSGKKYKPCGQLATWYEDDTNDSTDDLLQHIVITQQGRVIYDSGVVDYGPAGPTVTYPVSVILNTDANFGYWPGSTIGPNNGNCSASSNYPLSTAAFTGLYVIGAGSTCQRPSTGTAHVHTVTILATPQYKKGQGAQCAGGASTCYVVSYAKNYEIPQDFDLFLE
jgi:hypothetical protein